MRRNTVLKAVIMILMLGVLVFSGSLRAEKVEEVVNPRRAGGGFVTDGGGVLGAEYIKLIDGICRELQAKTTVELAVVTVGDMGGLEIEEFAEKVFRRFGIGAAGRDNGLLLLCSRDDHAVRLEVGYGLEALIPDALASRLLDENGLAELGHGQFGRGLFLAARRIAATTASAQGVTLTAPDPVVWPDQPAPPASQARPLQKKKAAWDPVNSSIYLAVGLLALGFLGAAWTLHRYRKARGRAARAKAAGGAGPIAMAWTAGVAGFIPVLVLGKAFLPPFAAMMAVPGLATTGQLLLGRLLRRRLATYHLPCAGCGAPMEMASESEDDRFLSEEQAAEEKAGGMDYEVWHCAACGNEETLATKLNKASKCPQCNRRTLTSSTTTLVAATKEQGGKVRVSETCINPKCGYSKVREHGTPRISSPSSSSSSSSRSSAGSFGGGRSGGGGAGKKF